MIALCQERGKKHPLLSWGLGQTLGDPSFCPFPREWDFRKARSLISLKEADLFPHFSSLHQLDALPTALKLTWVLELVIDMSRKAPACPGEPPCTSVWPQRAVLSRPCHPWFWALICSVLRPGTLCRAPRLQVVRQRFIWLSVHG